MQRYLQVKPYAHTRPLEFVGRCKERRYYGLELEIECNCSSPSEVLDTVKDHLVDAWEFKRDGSLVNGIEFESQPITLNLWLTGRGDQDFLRFIKHLPKDCRSHDTVTCGLHIHVNRNSFKDEDEVDDASKIYYFVNKYQKQLEKLGRRKWNNYCQAGEIAFKNYDIWGERKEALNITNSKTLEFRLFKGTLYVPTIKASISLVAAICEIVPQFSKVELENEDCWAKLMDRIVNGPNKARYNIYLKPYLRKKGMI